MTLDMAHKETKDLENLVYNYRQQGKTEAEVYLAALAELEKRRGKGLDLYKTIELIISAARREKFVAYKEVADASGLPWATIHWEIGKHLETVCEYAYRKGWPLLSAIVVNIDGIETGQLTERSKGGFLSAARQLGFVFTDPDEFVRVEQQKVFSWAAVGRNL